jgi:hypothetical protein
MSESIWPPSSSSNVHWVHLALTRQGSLVYTNWLALGWCFQKCPVGDIARYFKFPVVIEERV